MAGRGRFAGFCGRLCPAPSRWKPVWGLSTPVFAVALWLVLTCAGCQAHAVWWIVAGQPS